MQVKGRIIRFPFGRRRPPKAECDHEWIYLALGYEMCRKCGAVQKASKNASHDAEERRA